MTRALVLGLFLILSCSQSACIWKLWSGDEPIEEQEFDVYGTVESVNPEKLTIQSDKGTLEFFFQDSSIKGSDFGPGAYVHVYYQLDDQRKEITMVVEKVDD